MKIAMIIDAWEPIIGGGQVHVKNICEKLIENHNCEIDLFVRALQDENGNKFDKSEILYNGKMRIIRCGRAKNFFYFPERIFSIFSIFFRILKENKEQKYDIIHAHVYLGAVSGKIASFFLNIPIVLTCHGTQILDKGKKNFEYFLEKIILTKIIYDAEITVGKSLFKYKNRNNNIILIGNGINKNDFENIEYIKNKNIFKILFVGRFDEYKGVNILLEAIKSIKMSILENKNVELHLVGYGYNEEEYRKFVILNHLEKYVIFKGKIFGKDLLSEYKSSDVFVLPSISEGFGIVLLEAMMCEIPVISTYSGGPEDIIDNGKSGFLIEKNNVKELKNILEKFITGKTKNIHKIKQQAIKNISENFTWDIISEKIYNTYLNIGK